MLTHLPKPHEHRARSSGATVLFTGTCFATRPTRAASSRPSLSIPGMNTYASMDDSHRQIDKLTIGFRLFIRAPNVLRFHISLPNLEDATFHEVASIKDLSDGTI